MQNPYLIQNLKSQGLQYLLADTEAQKKALAAVPQKKSVPTIQSPAEQFKIKTLPKENPYKDKFPPLLKEKKSKKEPEKSAFEKNPLRQPVLPYDKWCPAWKQIQKQCKFSSEKPAHLSRQIIWTYAGLEYDLFTDTPSDKRRQLLNQIIKTLALPKGTHIFLPYRIINAEGKSEIAAEQEYSFFWSAIDLIRPRVLVVFGEQTISELDLPPLLPTQKHTLMPVTIYALDNIMLYTENESENTIMMNFLSANFKIFS
jgi:hypothetical protein